MQVSNYKSLDLTQGVITLNKLMNESDKLILVKFVAPHCGGCITLKPILEKLVQEYNEVVNLVEIDMVEETELAIEFDIRKAPTVILLKNGQEVNRILGLKAKKDYQNMIQQAV